MDQLRERSIPDQADLIDKRAAKNNVAKRKMLRRVLLAPALLIVVLLVVAPVILSVFTSLNVNGVWTLSSYITVLSEEPYRSIFGTTFSIAVVVTATSVLIVIPACMFFAQREQSARFFMAAMAISFTISVLVRTFAWQVILAYNGLLNNVLGALGFVDEPARLLYTRGAVIVAMVQIMVPYAALIIYAGMRRIDRDVIVAARSLGADPWTTFKETHWPQIKGPIVMAAIVVFTISAGFFVTPALIGGTEDAMIGMQMESDLVYNYANGASLAAASGTVLSIALIVIALILLRLGSTPYRKMGEEIQGMVHR